MNPLTKTLSLCLGLVLLGAVAVLLGTGTVGASPRGDSNDDGHARGPIPVIVGNTPLPVQGTVNANINGTPNVNATIINGAASPVLVRNVDDGQNLFQLDLTLTNDTATWGPTTSTCNGPPVSTQCQISFDVPAGQRLVVEHVSAFVDGVTGQTYQAFILGNLVEFLVLTKQISEPGLDTFTASQPMRVYIDSGRVPSPTVIVTNSNGGSFFARIDISGHLVPMS